MGDNPDAANHLLYLSLSSALDAVLKAQGLHPAATMAHDHAIFTVLGEQFHRPLQHLLRHFQRIVARAHARPVDIRTTTSMWHSIEADITRVSQVVTRLRWIVENAYVAGASQMVVTETATYVIDQIAETVIRYPGEGGGPVPGLPEPEVSSLRRDREPMRLVGIATPRVGDRMELLLDLGLASGDMTIRTTTYVRSISEL